jgi:dTDP-4-amino-4,6-dideoxygalactose transaminase
MGGTEQKFVKDIFIGNWISSEGADLNEFEKDLEKYLGNESHVGALSSGTAAIHLGLVIYCTHFSDRNLIDLRLAFENANIESRPLWKPMHLQPIFCNYPYYGTNVAETLFENGLCLSFGSNLTEEERERIKEVVFSFFS